MSRDDKKVEKAETVANVEAKVESPTPQKDKISPEELRRLAIERRSKSITLGEKGQIRALGHMKHIPKGFTGMYVTPDDAERLFDRGYDYAKDENGTVLTLGANKGRDAPEHTFPLMMAPNEIVQEDMDTDAKRSREIADSFGSTIEKSLT